MPSVFVQPAQQLPGPSPLSAPPLQQQFLQPSFQRGHFHFQPLAARGRPRGPEGVVSDADVDAFLLDVTRSQQQVWMGILQSRRNLSSSENLFFFGENIYSRKIYDMIRLCFLSLRQAFQPHVDQLFEDVYRQGAPAQMTAGHAYLDGANSQFFCNLI